MCHQRTEKLKKEPRAEERSRRNTRIGKSTGGKENTRSQQDDGPIPAYRICLFLKKRGNNLGRGEGPHVN